MTMPLEVAAIAVLGAVIAVAIGFLVAHGLWLRWHVRRREAALRRARRALNVLLSEGDPDGRQIAVLRSLPPRLRNRVLVELARSVTGKTRARITEAARDLGVIEGAVAGLGSRRWWRRLHSARLLQALHVEGRLFLPLLADPHVAVRAQAANWASDYPSPDVAEALLGLLDDTETLSRYAVEDALLRLGAVSVAPLAEHLASRRGHRVVAALDIAVALSQPAFVEPAVQLCRDELPEVRSRAAELLGAIGGRAGTVALLPLLEDTDARVRAAAARSLGRIGHWPAAVAIAQLLRDPSWEVRHGAGLALRSLGSPGRLLLCRFSDDEDRFAADMARQVLGLPAGTEVGA